jgi:hypothetical protein
MLKYLTIILCLAASSFAASPVLQAIDITSGPNSGNGDTTFCSSAGAVVTLYGKNFGSSRGSSTATFGGGAVACYPFWSDTKVQVALGASSATGDVGITVGGVTSTLSSAFTVRSGNIYYVASAGSGTTCSFGSPCTSKQGVNTKSACGDIIYYKNDADYTTIDTNAAIVSFKRTGCSAATPIALLSYPGVTAVVGTDTDVTVSFGMRLANGVSPCNSTGCPGWVVANLALRGWQGGLDVAGTSTINTDYRFVGNDIRCQNGQHSGGGACHEESRVSQVKFLFNTVHDVSTLVVTQDKLYHAVYLSTDVNFAEVAWNVIYPGKGCRGFQTHSSSGSNQHDISFHDNIVHDTLCDCVNFDTVDPSAGAVTGYNNILYNCGLDSTPTMGSNYACVYSPSSTDGGGGQTGSIDWYNNTMSNCGSGGGANAGQGCFAIGSNAQEIKFNISNNTCHQPSLPYVATGSGRDAAGFTGSYNNWTGNGAVPASITGATTNNTNEDEVFVSSADFHLTATSPADIRASGHNTSASADFDGVTRPQGATYSKGAYEYVSPATSIGPVMTGFSNNGFAVK